MTTSSSNLPAWDLSTEYSQLNAPDFLSDVSKVQQITRELSGLTQNLQSLMAQKKWSPEELARLVTGLVQSDALTQSAGEMLGNLMTFAHCESSTDMTNESAHKVSSQLAQIGSELEVAYQPQMLFLTQAPSEIFEAFIQAPSAAPGKFNWEEQRREHELQLSEKEESLLSALRISGHGAWGDLYEKISGTMKVSVELPGGKIEEMGLAQAQAWTKQSDPVKRQAAWTGIQKAWTLHQESAAAGLNALAGWRLEVAKRRSHTRKVDFLDAPLLGARIQRQTLEAMLSAVQKNVGPLRQTLQTMAKLHGKAKMDPWDLLAPSPVSKGGEVTFEAGLKMITEAFSSVAPEFGEFVMMMREKSWIEARVLPTKAGGAYCTSFPKSRSPRVFQTYMGSVMDISTLAHELGHAFHSWVMRDLPLVQQNYPMTLAETASIFAETVLGDYLLANGKSHDEKLSVAYSDVEGAVSLLLNICSRFEFEKSLYEQRSKGVLSPEELSELTDKAWTKWYGDSLSANDKMFWATKMHFSFAGVSFYNFPYTFGYLFSLSVYARRQELGSQFMTKYVELLRDTGRMTAEDLVQKHLGEDIRTEAFWQKSLDVVTHKLNQFQTLTRG